MYKDDFCPNKMEKRSKTVLFEIYILGETKASRYMADRELFKI